MRTSDQSDRVRPRDMIAQGSVEAIAATNSMKPMINRPPSTTALESTNIKVQNVTKLNTYCILAYDSATQKVNSAEATTLTSFSNEESLLPLEALNRLSNPVSGTSNIIVFKKETTPKVSAELKKTDASKEPNLDRNLQDQLPVIRYGSISTGDSKWPGSKPNAEKTIQEYRKMQLQGIEAEQQNVEATQKHAAETIENEGQKVKVAREIELDGLSEKKQPFDEAAKQKYASPTSLRNTSRDNVHRQEMVFSGSRPGRWVDSSVKLKKNKLAADKRGKTIKRIFMAGGFTAACCYCVGVASEIMRSF